MSIADRTARTFSFGKAGRMLKQTSPLETQDRPRGTSMSISCSPWEGLYMEQGNAAGNGRQDDASVAIELERFLDGLPAGK